jgi:hypothetical protein
MEQTYEFGLKLVGRGESEGEAWTDAVDSFCADPGEPHTSLCIDDHCDDDHYHLWEEVVNRMGWDEESQLIHLEEFIRSKGLLHEFVDYANDIATEEENANE